MQNLNILILLLIAGGFAMNPMRLGMRKGQVGNITNYPFLVYIEYSHEKQFCGGAIISPQFVLTAAECTNNFEDKQLITVRAGSSYKNNSQFERKVEEIFQHPLYNNAKPIDYNIAIIKLKKEIPFSTTVNSVTIPELTTTDIYRPNTNAYTAGWGQLDKKNKTLPNEFHVIKIPILSQSSCSGLFALEDTSERIICAGNFFQGVNTCKGDNGGPLVVNENTIIGIAITTNPCDPYISTTLFTKVAYYKTWINEVVTKNE